MWFHPFYFASVLINLSFALLMKEPSVQHTIATKVTLEERQSRGPIKKILCEVNVSEQIT